MKCEHCEHRFSLAGDEIGLLSAPGYLFYAGHALFINAGLLASVAILATALEPTTRMVMFMMGEVGFVGGCLAYAASVVAGVVRHNRKGGCVTCPGCGAHQKMRIWHV
jgi:hypothetical protein